MHGIRPVNIDRHLKSAGIEHKLLERGLAGLFVGPLAVEEVEDAVANVVVELGDTVEAPQSYEKRLGGGELVGRKKTKTGARYFTCSLKRLTKP